MPGQDCMKDEDGFQVIPFKLSIVCVAVSDLALSWCKMIRRFRLFLRTSSKTSSKQTIEYQSVLYATVATCPNF